MPDANQTWPNYENYCLHRIPGTIAEVLGTQIERKALPEDVKPSREYENVVLILLDGYGYKHWKQNNDKHAFLSNLKENGEENKLTSIYPSETASATTALNTGLTSSQHGLIGWNMYFEDFEAYIKTLPFTTSEGENPTQVHGEEFKPSILFEEESIHKLLSDQGITTHAIIPRHIEGTEVSKLAFDGAKRKPYLSLADLSVKLREELEAAENQNYFYTYISLIDKVSHLEGTHSEEYQAQLSQVSHALQELFVDKIKLEKLDDTLIILTADHGFTDVDPEENIDLLEYDIVQENLERKENGEKVLPFGSPRNTHLKLKEGTAEEVKQNLEQELDAHIWTREEALNQDLFGEEYRKDFGERIGDLIICHKEVGVWHGGEEEEMKMIGFHGGLTKEEMEIPFIAASLKDLV